MNPNQILLLLIAHFIGEFVLQDGAMATQKSKHLSWLVLHNIIYVVTIFCMSSAGIFFFDNWTWGMVATLASVNMVGHFSIGFIMSKANASSKEQKLNHLFWCGIGFEQLLYISMLIYSLYYLTL